MFVERLRIRCASLSINRTSRGTSDRCRFLKGSTGDPLREIDEIGYKFICPFKRGIVLLLDKTNEQYRVLYLLLSFPLTFFSLAVFRITQQKVATRWN